MARPKAGRNDPCPCGSGRKFKHCCFEAAARAEESPAEITWRRTRRALEGCVPTLLRFATETYGDQSIDEAWWEFMCWDDDAEAYDPDSPHLQLFLPWFLHRWAPDPHDTTIVDESLHDRTPTSVFLERRGAALDPSLRRYLEACLAAPLSFYEITACEPGRGFTARDLLTEEIADVIEHSASRTVRAGEILFAQIVRVDGIAMLEACPPCGLPPRCALDLLEVREKMRKAMGEVTANELHDYDLELREIYIDLIDEVLNPVLPELRNTDGDPLVWHRLSFDIDSADQAFEALKHLAIGQSNEELAADAEHAPDGSLVAVRFDWLKAGNEMHKTWDNTVLGAIEIRDKRLICEVNSEKRAAALRRIVAKALGKAARIRPTEITPLEPQLESALERRRAGTSRTPAAKGASDLEHEALMQLPEVREKLRAMMAAHYAAWLDDKLPALDGKTPRQAVRTRAGREKVTALVRQLEYDAPKMNPPLDSGIIDMLKAQLGLE